MPTIFTRIINGEIPCHKVAENEQFLAFLDINPIVRGHTLVIPKIEVPYIFSLDDKILADLMLFAKKVAKGIDATMNCLRTGVAVIGLEVAHTHIHLVPINSIGDLNFSRPKIQLTNEELALIAKTIKNAIT
jgi:histidine triad (HIT) family protein